MVPPHTALMKLHGIFPPITTPFDHDGNLYKAKVRHNVEKWNLTSLAGYAVCGSTGESVLLTEEEKLQLWGWVAEYAAPEKLLIAGTGMESVRETVSLTNKAADAGYKVAMVRTPHYYKNLVNNAEAQMLFFRAVADQVRIPVLIYNVPQATGVDISADAVIQLSEHPNIVGLKESSGNIEKLMRMAREAKPGFQVLGGSAPTLWPSLMVGAAGAVLAFANAAPYSTIAIWEALSHAGIRSRAGLAEPHLPSGRAGDGEVRHPRPQVRDGPQRLLRRTAPPAAHRAQPRSKTPNRRSLQRPEGVTKNPIPGTLRARHAEPPPYRAYRSVAEFFDFFTVAAWWFTGPEPRPSPGAVRIASVMNFFARATAAGSSRPRASSAVMAAE